MKPKLTNKNKPTLHKQEQQFIFTCSARFTPVSLWLIREIIVHNGHLHKHLKFYLYPII